MNKAVLITGSSTGIGFATASALAQRDYAVFAGVRTAADAARLEQTHRNITAVILDVSNDADIARAAAAVKERAIPLAGVVNNAGIAVGGPLEYLPIDRIRKTFDVNVFGALAVTQAMLPMLRESQGRVVFVSSVSGQIAPPYLAPYAASKFALEAMADSLRMELAQFGIAVCVMQPGNVKTPIWQKGRASREAMLAALPPQAIEQYGRYLELLVELTKREEESGIDASVVAECIVTALSDPAPRARYVIGRPAGWQRKMAALLPERWRDKMILRNFGSS